MASLAPPLSFRIDYRKQRDCLRAEVSGVNGSLETTLAYWRAIAVEVRAQRPRTLLVVDDMDGEPPSPEELESFVAAMVGQGFEGVRIAYVEAHVQQLPKVEVGEIHARTRGFDARVFASERAAELWLRYGAA